MPIYNIMAYIRSKKRKGKKYYYIVEGKLIKGKVKQKVIKYLGNITNILKRFNFYEKQNKKS